MVQCRSCKRNRWLLCCLLVLQLEASAALRPLPVDRSKVGGVRAGQLGNVTGTYRGKWDDRGSALQAPVLAQDKQHSGVVVFQLKAVESERPGVHNVEGDLVLRVGGSVNSRDTQFQLRGVYVVDSGRLHAVARPTTAVEAPVLGDEAAQHTADYRKALRQVAEDWAVPERGIQPAVQLPAASGSATAGKRKQCEFLLSLSASTGGNGSAAVGLPWDLGVGGSDGSILAEGEERRRERVVGGIRGALGNGTATGEIVVFNGTLVSRNCGVRVVISASGVQLDKYYAKAINYTLLMTAVAFLQILLLVRQMEATNTQALAARVSTLTIAQQALMDAYLCLGHLTAGIMIEPLFNNFATAAFLEFMVFAIFEMRFLVTLWRAQRTGNAEPWQLQREMSILYARFYAALLAGILLASLLHNHTTLLVFVVYTFWIPQIALCVAADAGQVLRPAYVIGTSVLRLLPPLYLYTCPSNLLRLPPQYGTAAALTAFLAAQAAILMAQHYYGPRCFVPKMLLPAKYDYHRQLTVRELSCGDSPPPPSPRPPAQRSQPDAERGGVLDGDEETGQGSVECVICMNPVDVTRRARRMVAPCSHCFHTACLQRWMDVKMECPTCRRPLPQP